LGVAVRPGSDEEVVTALRRTGLTAWGGDAETERNMMIRLDAQGKVTCGERSPRPLMLRLLDAGIPVTLLMDLFFAGRGDWPIVEAD
jgi:hypothetical protein